MGYVPGFETDLFISYAHKDNADGWVTGLDRFLSARVPQWLEHQASIEIWRDTQLDGFDRLWPTLKTTIERSALFLSICSPVYVTSRNCETEATHFLSSSTDAPHVERKSRMARAVIIPFASARDVRPPFQRDDTVGYRFYDKNDDGTFSQFASDSQLFRSLADKLSQHIAGVLRRMRDEVERTNARRAPSAMRKKVFVANCSRDRGTDRATVLNELKGHEVLTVADGVYTAAELSEQVGQILAQADCSVHLLGEKPGVTTDDDDQPIAWLQYKLALAHRRAGFTQVVWAPGTMQLQDARQKEFVERIRAFHPDVWAQGTEVLYGGLDELLRAIEGVLTKEKARGHVAGAGPLYLLCTKSDLDNDDENLSKLRDCLCSAGVLPEFPAFEDQDADLAEVERNLIAQSCATLIYYGRGGDGWVKLKRQTLIRVLGELKAQEQHVRALYLSEPPNTSKKIQYLGMQVREFAEAKGYPPLLVLGAANTFDAEHVKPLLDRLAGAQ